MHRLTLIAAALVLALVASPAAAYVDEELGIDFVESEAWFTATTTGIGNVDQQLGEAVGWSADEPTGTGGHTVATSHSGLLSLVDEGHYETQSFLARGVVTGLLDTIALDLYYRSPTENLCGMGLSLDLTVDGVKVLDMEGIGNTEEVGTYASGDHYVAEVALTNIHDALARRDMVGDETTEHELEILAQMYPICQEAIWSYGSADAPSQLTFNLDPAGELRYYTQFDVTNPPRPAE